MLTESMRNRFKNKVFLLSTAKLNDKLARGNQQRKRNLKCADREVGELGMTQYFAEEWSKTTAFANARLTMLDRDDPRIIKSFELATDWWRGKL